MNQHLLPSGRRAGAVSLLATSALVLALAPASARLTEIDVNATTSQSPTFTGQTFGPVGAYRMINGTVKGEVDPRDPLNAVIVTQLNQSRMSSLLHRRPAGQRFAISIT